MKEKSMIDNHVNYDSEYDLADYVFVTSPNKTNPNKSTKKLAKKLGKKLKFKKVTVTITFD